MPVCGPGSIVDVENGVVALMGEQPDVFAIVVDLVGQHVEVVALGMPAGEKVVVTDAVTISAAMRVTVDKLFGSLDCPGIQERRL